MLGVFQLPSIQNCTEDNGTICLDGSTEVAASCRYVLGDATNTAVADRMGNYDLTQGATFAVAPYPGLYGTSEADGSAQPRSGGTSPAVASGSPQIGVKDFLIEFVYKGTATGGYTPIFCNQNSGLYGGFNVMRDTSDLDLRIYTMDESTVPTDTYTPQFAEGEWVHIVIAMNRDGTTTNDYVLCVNGVQTAWGSGTNTPVPAAAKDITTSDNIAILNYPNDSFANGLRDPAILQYAALYIETDFLPNGAACAAAVSAYANQRFMELTAGTGTFNGL